ncbi:putative hexaprenyl pyrophosphate synthase, mitochondrial [Wickerhamiella sorbophila]|uniref:Putative hexaprenyl pyrophosphate synthase, mitochondrial n=1 Tax=Wickerhamiella sorbophila TaxID=45607 RepID=A0A2T0FGQ9_9ASCO|nr:putative hexaprenyl pyrophosphate synthase, mitochondrial [Wickerhamiella sorbophila]PRT54147.1 putative hexaprenyl pyrophosphate synthase, mitochondrial [Wickerhamiella sorbophila]
MLVRRYSVLSKALGKMMPPQAEAAVRLANQMQDTQDPKLKAEIAKVAKLVEPDQPLRDPFSIVSAEMSTLAGNIASLIGSGHPTLNKVAAYYFQSQGKHVRPLIVLLLSKALSEIPEAERTRYGKVDKDDVHAHKPMTGEGINDPLSPLSILHGINPNLVLNPLSRPQDPFPSECNGILPKQRRLAEIVEMIHTASLLHDDVIDNSETRRSMPSGNVAFSNKMAILAGDFLLGRASVAIARLRNAEVIELLSTTIANLVEGEFMQLKNSVNTSSEAKKASFEYYIHKTYLKTASLMSKSCRATAVLSGANDDVVEASYMFGRNLGLCFQIVDDMLDYTVAEDRLGKPAGADLKLGLATAPVLYAWEEYPELGEMIKRKFSEPDDVYKAREYVRKTDGLKKTRELAVHYHDEALRQLSVLPDSEALQGLKSLTNAVLNRSK